MEHSLLCINTESLTSGNKADMETEESNASFQGIDDQERVSVWSEMTITLIEESTVTRDTKE